MLTSLGTWPAGAFLDIYSLKVCAAAVLPDIYNSEFALKQYCHNVMSGPKNGAS
jgi:hypothetical protein